MSTIINTIKGIFAVSAFSMCLAGCSENIMDDINKDTNHTNSVDAKFILTDVITSTAFSNVSGDFNTYGSAYVEYEVGVDNQLYNAEIRLNEPTAASTFNNVWSGVYTSLKNARIAIGQCQEGGRDEGNEITKGIALVLAAYNGALLADMFGDVPFSEAALVDENGAPVYMNPKIDKQEDVYKTIMQELDDAIVSLQQSDRSPISNYDLAYKGDATGWIKLAYGLKARYTMRLIHRSADVAGDMNKILDYVAKSFTSPSEQAEFAVYDNNNINPYYGFNNDRAGLVSSQSLGEKLIERQDPRLQRVLLTPSALGRVRNQITDAGDPNYVPGPNGSPEQNMQKYSVSAFYYASTAPTILMSYHELKFLQAEALCRLNRIAEAETVLKEAVVAGIANAERSMASAIATLGDGISVTTGAISEEAAKAYFDNNVKPLFTSNPLKETMIQKYLALWGASGEATETYSDIRRMKALNENFITLKNPGQYPLRCPYGNSDTTTNPEVKEAYGDGNYIYSDPVWWAGESR